MENMEMLLEPIRTSLHTIGEFLPRVLLALAILIVGWLLAKAIRFTIVKMLRAFNFNVVTEKSGVDKFLQQGGGELDATAILGALTYWLVILAALMVAFNSVGLTNVTDLLGRVVLFVPRVMVAVLIIAFGTYFSRFIGTAVATYCRNVGIGDAGVLGRIAFYAILVFVILIALDQLGLGDIIRQTFLIVMGAAALGLALGLSLAFGLGGQHRAAALLERWSRRNDESDTGGDRKPPAL
jgi:Mechanosensitive ion channel, conserved TM helix